MTPPPTPVPKVMKTWWSTSLPAPKRNSPQAAALASFSTVTDRPVLPPISSSRRMFSISCRLGAKITLFSAARISPGTATHTPPTSKPSLTSKMARAMLSISRFGGTAWVGYLTSFKIFPSGETTAPAIFVPPTSTPMAFIPYLSFPLRSSCSTPSVPSVPPTDIPAPRYGRRKRSPGRLYRLFEGRTSRRALTGATVAGSIVNPFCVAPSSYARLLQATFGERVEGDVIEARDDQIRVRGGQQLLVVGPREAEGRHIARLRRLHAVRGVLDDEALSRRYLKLLCGGQEDLRVGLALLEIPPADVRVQDIQEGVAGSHEVEA